MPSLQGDTGDVIGMSSPRLMLMLPAAVARDGCPAAAPDERPRRGPASRPTPSTVDDVVSVVRWARDSPTGTDPDLMAFLRRADTRIRAA